MDLRGDPSPNRSANATGTAPAHLWVTSLLGATLLATWVLGAAGNAYTLAVTSTALRRSASLCVYVVNLALADLLYLSTIPFVVCTYFARDWLFGETGCRVLLSLDLLTMHASVFVLGAMSLERYRAVASPFRARRASAASRRLAALAIWAASFLLALPMMLMVRLHRDRPEPAGPPRRICSPTWTPAAFRAYLTVLFCTSVLGPGLMIAGLYAGLAWRYWAVQAGLGPLGGGAAAVAGGRRGPKRRVVTMVFAIVLAHWACFLPFWAWQLAKLYSPGTLGGLSPATHTYVNFALTCLTYGNSCVNPLLYTLLTRSYRDYLAQKARPASSAGPDPAGPGGAVALRHP
nr:PREDICTED: urotensin-2 receptor-like [Lepisosteus oculatus]